jgi:hypothetical protein
VAKVEREFYGSTSGSWLVCNADARQAKGELAAGSAAVKPVFNVARDP